MTEPTDAELDEIYRSTFLAMPNVARQPPQTVPPMVRDFARAVLAKWGTPPAVAGNHPYAIQWDAELGRTAMRFVDRAGDVHPGIDDAETICAEFHAAMSAVIERMPHVQRMSPTPQPTQAQAGAVPPEAEPIVRNCVAPGDLKPGDYVFASRWSDCDPGDPWEVGFVSEVGVYPESMTKAGYVVLQGGSRRWGRAMRITPEQGRRICEQFPSMERLPQDYDAIARVFGIKGGQHG